MERVLQVLGTLQRGGAETMIMNIYREIDRNKMNFDFLVKENVADGYEEEVKKLGGRIFVVPSAKKIGVKNFVFQQMQVMKEFGPYSAVHAHVNEYSGLSLLAAKMAGVKIRISHSHNTHFSNPQKLMIGRTLIRMFSTRRIACGEEAGKALFLNMSYEVLPNAINAQKFLISSSEERVELRKKLNMPADELCICHIGRFNAQKNHEFIVRVLKKIKGKRKVKLYFLGNGELLDTIMKRTSQAGVDDIVLFCGSVSNVEEYIKAADLFILPSVHEGLPVTMIEAQCSGIPCIVSSNVTREADLGIGCVRFLDLDEDKWCEAIFQSEICMTDVRNRGQMVALQKRKYDITTSVNQIMTLYM